MLQQRVLQDPANGSNQQTSNYMGSQMRAHAQLHKEVAGSEPYDLTGTREANAAKVIKPVVS